VNRLRRARRGQAMVELAISMLVIVPVIMYILFIDDLLRAKLDLEEAVMTAPWEYARVDFEKGAAGNGVRSAIRLSWCDHTTAYNSYNRTYDCDNTIHHVALTAHECWLTAGAKQVTCSVDKDFGKLDGLLTAGTAHDNWTKGGLVRCSARLGVINYYLPMKLFEEFTEEQITRAEKMHGSPHAAAKSVTVESHYLLEEQQAGLLVDTWKLEDMPQRMSTPGSGDFKSRVQDIYKPYFLLAALEGESFYQKIIQDKYVNPAVLLDGLGDDPYDANLVFDPDIDGTFNENMHGSPYDVKRGQEYMGQDQIP
jgi:hypothetical protein